VSALSSSNYLLLALNCFICTV